MKMRSFVSTAAAAALATLVCASAAHATCTQTGFVRGGINLTAAVIAPLGESDISGGPAINATGCNIGVFYGPGTSGTVDSTEVYGANYFGILVAGDNGEASGSGAASVDVTNNYIHDIGESPFNGTQHGVGIYFRACPSGSSATGTISGNTVNRYQKGGITVNCPGAAASISGNTVTGVGPVDYIAQNGIQVGFGATGQVMRNTVTGNSYSGTNDASSAGILVFGGCGSALTTGVQIVKNTIGSTTASDGNDIGVALANYDQQCSTAPSTATNIKVINNTITNRETTNVSGDCPPNVPCSNAPYQAGILDSGVNDKLINNVISGIGYDPNSGIGFFAIDTDSSTGAKVHANSVP